MNIHYDSSSVSCTHRALQNGHPENVLPTYHGWCCWIYLVPMMRYSDLMDVLSTYFSRPFSLSCERPECIGLGRYKLGAGITSPSGLENQTRVCMAGACHVSTKKFAPGPVFFQLQQYLKRSARTFSKFLHAHVTHRYQTGTRSIFQPSWDDSFSSYLIAAPACSQPALFTKRSCWSTFPPNCVNRMRTMFQKTKTTRKDLLYRSCMPSIIHPSFHYRHNAAIRLQMKVENHEIPQLKFYCTFNKEARSKWNHKKFKKKRAHRGTIICKL